LSNQKLKVQNPVRKGCCSWPMLIYSAMGGVREEGVWETVYKYSWLAAFGRPLSCWTHSWTEQLTFQRPFQPDTLFLILAISLFLIFYCCPIFSLPLSSLHFALQINAYHFVALLPVPYVERMCSQHSWGDGAFWLMVSGCCMGMLEWSRTEILSQLYIFLYLKWEQHVELIKFSIYMSTNKGNTKGKKSHYGQKRYSTTSNQHFYVFIY